MLYLVGGACIQYVGIDCGNIGQLSLIIMQFIICNYTCYNYNNLHVIIQCICSMGSICFVLSNTL